MDDEYTVITEAIHDYVQKYKIIEGKARRKAAAEAKTAAEAVAAEAVVAAEVAKATADTAAEDAEKKAKVELARVELGKEKTITNLRERVKREKKAAQKVEAYQSRRKEIVQKILQEQDEELQKAKTLTVEQRAELNKLATDIPQILESELDDAAKEKLKKTGENLDAARTKMMTFEQVKALLRKIYITALASAAAGKEASVSDLQFIVAQEPLNSRLQYLMMRLKPKERHLLWCVNTALQSLLRIGETVVREKDFLESVESVAQFTQ
jgi:hypothetical protein